VFLKIFHVLRLRFLNQILYIQAVSTVCMF